MKSVLAEKSKRKVEVVGFIESGIEVVEARFSWENS